MTSVYYDTVEDNISSINITGTVLITYTSHHELSAGVDRLFGKIKKDSFVLELSLVQPKTPEVLQEVPRSIIRVKMQPFLFLLW